MVNLIKKPNRQIKTAWNNVINDCRFCGRTYNRGECPAYGNECNHCKKKNHFANVCRRRKLVKEIQHTITESSDDEYCIDIIYVNDCDRKDRLLCDCIYRSPTKEKALIVQSTIKICEVISEDVQRQLTF